jgi:hypothetical protein
MKPARMKLNTLALIVLLAAASSPCFADMGVVDVSKARAKELGMEMRFTANGPNDFWVELEFKAGGELKDAGHVDLEVGDGKTSLVSYASLQEQRTSSGSIVVRFMANRANLDKIELTVVAGAPDDLRGYILHVKDFVEQEKAR